MSLENTITLSVDSDDAGTLVSVPFTRFDESLQNRTVYISGNHSLITPDKLSFYRTFPKRAGNFNGTAKESIKFAQDVSVAGFDQTTVVSGTMIAEIKFAIPLGVSDADELAFTQRLEALLSQRGIMDKLIRQQDI